MPCGLLSNRNSIDMGATYNYIDMITKLKEQFFIGDHAAFYSLACAVACICAAFALIGWYNHMMNDPWGMFDLKSLIYIIVPIFLVCNFYTLVLQPLDGLTSIITKGITASVSQDREGLQGKVNEAYMAVENAIKGNTMRGQFEEMVESGSSQTSLDNGASGNSNSVFESNVETTIDEGEKPGFWQKVWGAIKGGVQDAMGFPYKAISTILSWLMSCIVDLVRFLLTILSGVFLIILGLLGPFIFAFAPMSSFNAGIANWFARYIQISFWIPVCSIIDYINIHMKSELLTVFAQNNLVEKMVFPTFFLIFLDIATLAMLLAVPTISSWIIESDGAGQASSKMANTAKKAARFIATKGK